MTAPPLDSIAANVGDTFVALNLSVPHPQTLPMRLDEPPKNKYRGLLRIAVGAPPDRSPVLIGEGGSGHRALGDRRLGHRCPLCMIMGLQSAERRQWRCSGTHWRAVFDIATEMRYAFHGRPRSLAAYAVPPARVDAPSATFPQQWFEQAIKRHGSEAGYRPNVGPKVTRLVLKQAQQPRSVIAPSC